MTKLKFIQTVVNTLVDYYINGMSESIERNNHLTGGLGRTFADSTEKAILVDIINNIAIYQGVDYGMTVSDFTKLVESEKTKKSRRKPNQTVKDEPNNIVDLKF